MRLQLARWFGLLGTPLMLAPLALSEDAAVRCTFTVLLMAVFWSFELLPLAVTSLLPVVLLPVLGVLDTESTSRIYMKATDMFYLGSLMVALGVEEAELHRRIALKALTYSGTRTASVMLGFMLVTAFLSMWISNAASTAMMVPILEAVLAELDLTSREKTMMLLSVAFSANIGGTATIIGTPPNIILLGFLDEVRSKPQACSKVSLSTAFTRSGGVACPLCKPWMFWQRFRDDHPLNFGSWMAFAVPLALVNLLLCWLLLQLCFVRRGGGSAAPSTVGGSYEMLGSEDDDRAPLVAGGGGRRQQVQRRQEAGDAEEGGSVADAAWQEWHDDGESMTNIVAEPEGSRAAGDRADLQAVIRQRYEALGPATTHQISMLMVFGGLVLLWFFRKPGFMPGWAEALARVDAKGAPVVIDTASETIFVTILLFVLPADWAAGGYGPGGSGNKALLDWPAVQKKFPWGIILLMGGGFALAEGAKVSCLTARVGGELARLAAVLPPFLLLPLLCAVTSIISAIASNSATTSMLIPVVLELAVTLGMHPIYLALGVTLTASQSFMLPVSTPPNAIVFTAGGLSISDMASVGGLMNLLTIITTIVFINTSGMHLLFDLDIVPPWANVTTSVANIESC